MRILIFLHIQIVYRQFFFADESLNGIKLVGGFIAFTGVILYKVSIYYEKQNQIEYEAVEENQKSNSDTRTIQSELLEGESLEDLTFTILDEADDDTNNENGHLELTESELQEKPQIV